MKRFLFLLRTEINRVLRERRSLAVSLALPLLLSPLLTYSMLGNLRTVMNPAPLPVVLQGDGAAVAALRSLLVEANLQIAEEGVVTLTVDAVDTAVAPRYTVEIAYDSSETRAQVAMARVMDALRQWENSLLVSRFQALQLPTELATPLDISVLDQDEHTDATAWLVGLSLILAIGMWPMLGGIMAALDTGALERERKALEPIIAAPTNPWLVVFSKYGGILFSAFLSGGLGIGICLLLYRYYGGEVIASVMPPALIGQFLGPTLMLTVLSGAVALFFSLLAKSTKEATLYLVPLQLMFLIGMFLGDTLQSNLGQGAFLLPIANIFLLLNGIINATLPEKAHVLLYANNIAVTLLFLWLSARLLRSERVLE